MRFYELRYNIKHYSKWTMDIAFEFKTRWFASKRDAAAFRLALFREGKLSGRKKDSVIISHDIPIVKTELLAWMNTYELFFQKRPEPCLQPDTLIRDTRVSQ